MVIKNKYNKTKEGKKENKKIQSNTGARNNNL